MRKTIVAVGGIAAFASLALFSTGPVWAQHGGHGGGHGGGHAGGGHAGGGHVGGAHVGAAHVGGARVGGFSGVYHAGGVSHYGGAYHVGAYRPYSGGYGAYRGAYYGAYRPYYHGYYGGYYRPYFFGAYAPYYDYYYPYDYAAAFASYSPYVGGFGAAYYPLVASSSGVDAPPADDVAVAPAADQPSPDGAAHLQLTVPENAEVLVDGLKTVQAGSVREFVTPKLTPGTRYSYKVTVRYANAQGKAVEDTREIRFQADDWFSIDFTRPPPAQPLPTPALPSLPKVIK